jgi:hypothetical protein
MPRPPKDPKIRQRRNVDVTAATLIDTSPLVAGKPPALPERRAADGKVEEWHEFAEEAWEDIWASPMASEYTQADVHRLVMYVDLLDKYWKGATVLAAEVRLQGVCLGVTPIDRRRLQWEIKRVEPNGKKPEAPKRPERIADPRSVLKAVP